MAVKLFNKEWAEVTDEGRAVAKTTPSFYFIKVVRGHLYDPHGPDSNKLRTAEFRKVSSQVFDLYRRFLIGKDSSLLTFAQRTFINE